MVERAALAEAQQREARGGGDEHQRRKPCGNRADRRNRRREPRAQGWRNVHSSAPATAIAAAIVSHGLPRTPRLRRARAEQAAPPSKTVQAQRRRPTALRQGRRRLRQRQQRGGGERTGRGKTHAHRKQRARRRRAQRRGDRAEHQRKREPVQSAALMASALRDARTRRGIRASDRREPGRHAQRCASSG